MAEQACCFDLYNRHQKSEVESGTARFFLYWRMNIIRNVRQIENYEIQDYMLLGPGADNRVVRL